MDWDTCTLLAWTYLFAWEHSGHLVTWTLSTLVCLHCTYIQLGLPTQELPSYPGMCGLQSSSAGKALDAEPLFAPGSGGTLPEAGWKSQLRTHGHGLEVPMGGGILFFLYSFPPTDLSALFRCGLSFSHHNPGSLGLLLSLLLGTLSST